MSTEFNPSIPTNDDTVYDAYFSFHKNMEAINNLLGVDHVNGTALQNRGMHRAVTFSEPMDTVPQVQGNLGMLYTSTQSADPNSNAPILKYTNRNGTWEIPFGANSGGGGPNPQPPPSSYDQDFEETGNPNVFEGTGYVIFPNKFMVVWARGGLTPGASVGKSFKKEMKRVFFGTVTTSSPGATINLQENVKDKFLSWNVSRQGYYVKNGYKTWSLNFQVFAVGVAV